MRGADPEQTELVETHMKADSEAQLKIAKIETLAMSGKMNQAVMGG